VLFNGGAAGVMGPLAPPSSSLTVTTSDVYLGGAEVDLSNSASPVVEGAWVDLNSQSALSASIRTSWEGFSALRIIAASEDGVRVRIEAVRSSDGEVLRSDVIEVDENGVVRLVGEDDAGHRLYRIEGTPESVGIDGSEEGESQEGEASEGSNEADYMAAVDALFESGEWASR
jgi:hypothetical protein